MTKIWPSALISFVLAMSPASSRGAILWSTEAPYKVERVRPDVDRICELVEREANKHHLPPPLLARIIWLESNFDTYAVDTRGGLGLAKVKKWQVDRGEIENPFDIEEAIPFAATQLSALRAHFGNDGLAVAAYWDSASAIETLRPRRAADLPWQAANFVYDVTGHDPSDYFNGQKADESSPPLQQDRSFSEACRHLPTLRTSEQAQVEREHLWAAVVAGNWRKDTVTHDWVAFAQNHQEAAEGLTPVVQKWRTPLGRAGVYAAKVYTDTRVKADTICDRLHQAGGVCVVLRN